MAEGKQSGQERLTIRANFAWNFTGKMIFAVSRAIILILIAKLGSAAMVGQYALAFALTTPVFVLADLDLRAILATDVQNRLAFGGYFSLRSLTTLLALMVISVMAALQSNPDTAVIIVLVGLAKCFETLSDILHGLMQKKERLDQPGRSLVLRGVLSILTVGALLGLGQGLALALAGMALSWLAILVLYDLPASRFDAKIGPQLQPAPLWNLFRLSLPLGIVLLFASLNRNLPNYFIQNHRGTEALGYFASMVNLMAIGTILVGALGQSANARLARLFNDGAAGAFTRLWRQLAAFALAAGLGIFLVAAIFGRPILSLLYTPEYAAYADVFAWIMLAGVFGCVSEITGFAITAARRFRIQPAVQGTALLAGLILNALLIPRYGLISAAWCLLATAVIQLAGNLFVLRNVLDHAKGKP